MSPVTRSRRNAQASSSKITLDRDEDVLSDHPSVGIASPNEAAEPEPSSDHTTLESLLTRALGGAKQLQRENASLHKKVKALEAKLDRVINADDAPLQPQRGKRTAASVAELRSQIAQLRKQVRRLERSNEKQRKRIHQLSLKELKTEAEDLVDAAEFEVGDSAYKMRKLLRRFHDLMLENSLDENEECLICMEPLQPRKSRSLPCQHTFCDSCVRQLPSEPGEPESIRCPTCRAVCLREEAELVQYTASEQWDALLDVAKQWAKMDVRREEETTEEEDAEQFIDDELEETTTTASEPVPANPLQSSPEPQGQTQQEVIPQTPSRLRKRQALVTPSPEPEPPDEDAAPVAGPSSSVDADQPDPGQANGTESTPTSPTASLRRTPSYAQSPRKDKRRMLEQLAEARSKKRRY